MQIEPSPGHSEKERGGYRKGMDNSLCHPSASPLPFLQPPRSRKFESWVCRRLENIDELMAGYPDFFFFFLPTRSSSSIFVCAQPLLTPLFSPLSQSERMYPDTAFSEMDLGPPRRIRNGQSLEVVAEDHRGEIFSGNRQRRTAEGRNELQPTVQHVRRSHDETRAPY